MCMTIGHTNVSSNKLRTERIVIRVTTAQKDAIKKTADSFGLSVSDYLRSLALQDLQGNLPEKN